MSRINDLREELVRYQEDAANFRFEAQNQVPRDAAAAQVYATLAVSAELRASSLLTWILAEEGYMERTGR